MRRECDTFGMRRGVVGTFGDRLGRPVFRDAIAYSR